MEDKEINIIALEFPESVRTRTGMYLGSTDNPDVCLREVIDNSVDELYGCSTCNKIDIQIKSGKQGEWYVVADNGRGIPIILDEDKGITKTELAMTTINAGSKFKGEEVSVGMNGTGASAVNATCSRFIMLSKITDLNYNKSIEAVKDFYISNPNIEGFYVIEFDKGIKIFESAMSYDSIIEKYRFNFPTGMSTITAFMPDPTIWKSIEANYNKKSLSYLGIILNKFYNKTCEINIDGQSVDTSFESYPYEFIKTISITEGEKTRSARFYINFDVDKDLSVTEFTGSVNSLIVNRGIHIDWAKRSFQDALKTHYHILHDYTWCGLKINVIALCGNVDFSSQTKERVVKLDNLYIDEVMPELACEFHNIFAKNEDYFKTHVQRLNEYADSINKISAINKVKQVVGTVDGGNRVRSKLPSSVKDAASNDRSQCELFIVEGQSASGTMLKARNPEIHAIMELRGVPLNSINLDLDTIMDNEEMCGIVTAIGSGVNEYFRLENCRYGKVILSADSDPDGERINSMILGFIARKMTFLIEAGMVYIALAPFYAQGNTYAYPGEDYRTIIDMNKPFTRIKGIGEASVIQAKEWYFDVNKRRLIQIKANNLDYVFSLLTSSYERKNLMIRKNIIIDKYGTGIL